MRQQPVQAPDRRPVDPTPIVQLRVIDKNGDDVPLTGDSKRDESGKKQLRRPSGGPNGMTFMQNPYYFLFACLVGGDEEQDELHIIEDGKTRYLIGTPVSSLFHLKDTDNTDAAFFVFPDLGVRKEGRYKLKLTLFEIVEKEVYYCTTMYTSTFNVYSAKKFPGMQKATELSMAFADQGLKIRIRNAPRRSKKGSKRKSSVVDSEEDAESQRKRSRGPSVMPLHSPYGYGDPNFYRPGEAPSYAYSGPPNGYYPPQGYHPAHGQHMPPPPVPTFDPYRPHGQPPGQYGYYQHPPPQAYGTNGRPATQPGSSRQQHHPSFPHPGYFHDSHAPSHPYYPGPGPQVPPPNAGMHHWDRPTSRGHFPSPLQPNFRHSPVVPQRPQTQPSHSLSQLPAHSRYPPPPASAPAAAPPTRAEDSVSQAGSLSTSVSRNDSPDTTPGGTKPGRRMGLGDLID
ncbi:hypothetical protein P7C73_g6113, partial [Tremellales sp. Uapishka_1]